MRAFTLIELLVVVAIIAIVAAIAVPNFLEAQTRAKVSRSKADLRTLATALEMYRVDTNHYPPDFGSCATCNTYISRMKFLTSPIGYITSVPEDNFAGKAVQTDPALGAPYQVPNGSGNYIHPFPYDFAYRFTKGIDEEVTYPGRWSKNISRTGRVSWAMRGVGPDLKAYVLGDDRANSYDPTNGTVSRGQLFYLGPGIGFEEGPAK
ncbi:hypothetical protein BH09SUM1_BH09SUM1_00120 [soil metagenome]